MLSSLAPFVGVPLLAEAAAQLPDVRLHIAESLTGDILERVQRGGILTRLPVLSITHRYGHSGAPGYSE